MQLSVSIIGCINRIAQGKSNPKKGRNSDEKKKRWIVLIALLLIVLLGVGGYQAYRFPDTFRSLTDKSVDEKEVASLVEQMLEK